MIYSYTSVHSIPYNHFENTVMRTRQASLIGIQNDSHSLRVFFKAMRLTRWSVFFKAMKLTGWSVFFKTMRLTGWSVLFKAMRLNQVVHFLSSYETYQMVHLL